MGVENYTFWSETGSEFEELGSTPPPRIPRSTPHPPPPGRELTQHIRNTTSEVAEHNVGETTINLQNRSRFPFL